MPHTYKRDKHLTDTARLTMIIIIVIIIQTYTHTHTQENVHRSMSAYVDKHTYTVTRQYVTNGCSKT